MEYLRLLTKRGAFLPHEILQLLHFQSRLCRTRAIFTNCGNYHLHRHSTCPVCRQTLGLEEEGETVELEEEEDVFEMEGERGEGGES